LKLNLINYINNITVIRECQEGLPPEIGQDLLGSSAPTHCQQIYENQLRRQAMLVQQTAEWGMLSEKASFPRLKD
jgi:hypothetical protein